MPVNLPLLSELKSATQQISPGLVVVSKKRSTKDIITLYENGQNHFAENYVQEALVKITELESCDITWHFIGQIQSRKIKTICQNFHWIHSIDQKKHIDAIAKLPLKAPMNTCIQVTLDEQVHRGGTQPDQLDELLRHAMENKNIHLRGLMYMANQHTNITDQFHLIQKLFLSYQRQYQLDTLSMGISSDYRLALSHGSTLIRIGNALFN
jgi:pyridoxal phosphate enzyme (YggS family)